MKKTVFAMLAVACGMASCGGNAPKADLKSDVDTLSYMLGASATQGLKEYALGQLGVDSAQWDNFLKGIQEGTKDLGAAEKARLAGVQIGQQISNQMFEGMSQNILQGDTTQKLSKENFLAGFFKAVSDTAFNLDSAETYVRTNSERIQKAALEKQYADWIKENTEFLAKNKGVEGVVTLPSGLQYQVLKAGNGEVPTETSRVKVNYKGTLIDGVEFDSNEKSGQPAEFAANQVIKGWTEALTLMPVGSKWKLFIPQELAYGARPMGGTIKPFSTLIFEVELLEVVK